MSRAEGDLPGLICSLSGKCNSLPSTFGLHTLFPLVIFWFFIYWHHDNTSNGFRLHCRYTGNRDGLGIPWWLERKGFAVMFIRLVETKVYSKHLLHESCLSWLFSMGRRIKLFITITFVGLTWDSGVELAQTPCDSHFSKPLDNKSSLRLTFPWQKPSLVVTAISK